MVSYFERFDVKKVPQLFCDGSRSSEALGAHPPLNQLCICGLQVMLANWSMCAD